MSTTRTGYCTVDDVRRVMQETEREFDSGALGEGNNQLVVDAIAGLTDWIDSKTKRHWYVDGGLDSDDQNLIATAPRTRDDEHDFETTGATVDGQDVPPFRISANSDALLESPPAGHHKHLDEHEYAEPKRNLRVAFGEYHPRHDGTDKGPAYTPIEFDRKDVSEVTELLVANADGTLDDWTGPDYTGGIGVTNSGEDWWVRVNNRGVSQLYLDIHALDDDLASLSNAVYVTFSYGNDDLTMTVRRGVAHLAAAILIVDDEFQAGLPDQGGLINVETKAERWERKGLELLSEHWVDDPEGVLG